MLIGDDFVLIGRDYLVDTITDSVLPGKVQDVPERLTPETAEAFAVALFKRSLDPERAFHFPGRPGVDRPGTASSTSTDSPGWRT